MTLGVWEAARVCNRRLIVQLAVDFNSRTLAVYRENFPSAHGRVIEEDVAQLFDGLRSKRPSAVERYWQGKLRGIDLIVAGPPCQGHSDLNNSTRRDDPRNDLYLRVVRAVELIGPKAVIIENVPAVKLDRGAVVNKAVDWLGSLGYQIWEGTVNLIAFGVPQLRKRHILIACRSTLFDLSALIGHQNSSLTVGQFLHGLEDKADENGPILDRPARMTAENRRRMGYLFRRDVHDLPNSLRPSCHRDKEHAYVSMYGRMHWDRPAQTITSGFGSMGQGRYVHPTRQRLLSPHEAARLQGFPDFYDFSKAGTLTSLREMIANAVPPQFTAYVVSRMVDSGVL